MITIYKYKLDGFEIELDLPIFSNVLSVGSQMSEGMEEKESLYLWVKVNTDLELSPIEKRCFIVYGTGHEINVDAGKYLQFIGTVQMQNGLVWHVFEKLPAVN